MSHLNQKKEMVSEKHSNGWKHNQNYNALGIMINRIRSLSSATNNPNDVIVKPDLMKHTARPSVIKPRTSLQEHYNVPVQNKFSHLLN